METRSPLRAKLCWNTPQMGRHLWKEVVVAPTGWMSPGGLLLDPAMVQKAWASLGAFRGLMGPRQSIPAEADWPAYQNLVLERFQELGVRGATCARYALAAPHLVEEYFRAEQAAAESIALVGLSLTGSMTQLKAFSDFQALRVHQHQERTSAGFVHTYHYLLPRSTWAGHRIHLEVDAPEVDHQSGDPVQLGIFDSWVHLETTLALWEPGSAGRLRRLSTAWRVAQQVC